MSAQPLRARLTSVPLVCPYPRLHLGVLQYMELPRRRLLLTLQLSDTVLEHMLRFVTILCITMG